MDFATPTVLVPALFAAWFLVAYVRSVAHWGKRSWGRPLPPGPPSYPIIGHMLSIPMHKPWVGYRDLCAKYGEMVYLSVMGANILVLGSENVLFEYLDRRSANTSDRKHSTMLELTGGDLNFGFFPYGQWWRRHRRAFWQHFNPTAVRNYLPLMQRSTVNLLNDLLRDPAQLKQHIRYNFSATLMKLLYDVEVTGEDDPHIVRIEATNQGASEGLASARFLIEFMPFLKHLLKSHFAPARIAAHAMRDVPFIQTKATMETNDDHKSIVGSLLTKLARPGLNGAALAEEEEVVKNVGFISIAAGADTTFSTLVATFLAVSLNPHVLKKAHAELDAVVGPHRLPDFGDKDSLVYINAIIRESLRWHNVLPVSLPHCTTADDELRGYFIPANTMIIPNTWACMHDPAVYEDPDGFRPERFIKDGKLDTSVRDPFGFVFGFGRRICPGRYYAEASLFINIASTLHVFDITPPLDEDGHPIKIEMRSSDGFLSYPEDCRCTIKPRSTQAESLILAHANSTGPVV